MTGDRKASIVELHAFIDGALDGERMREVKAEIEADPALAERVAAFRSDKAALRRIYGHLIDRPVPKEWIALARNSKSQPKMSWRAMSAAAAVVLIVAGTLTYLELQPRGNAEIVQTALDARKLALRFEQIVPVEADAASAQYDEILSTGTALPVKVPDLKELGYQLAGMRLYRHPSGERAAELRYRNGENRLFTLYIRRSDGTTQFDQFERDGLRICVWQDDEVGTVMTGDVSVAAMQRLAALAYSGLTL